MKKIFLFLALSLFCLSTNPTFAQGDNQVDLYFFYGQGCSHCSKMSLFLEEMQDKYPTLNVIKKETYLNSENRKLFQEMASAFETEIEGVPTVFIGSETIVGFSNTLGDSLENKIKNCTLKKCPSPIEKINAKENITKENDPVEEPDEKPKISTTITIPAVLIAAAVDAINPCAFAVLVILLTAILAAGVKKRALLAGLAFTASIYISYFLMGVGLFSAIQISGISHGFYIFVAILAILIGLLNLKDYLWYGKWFVMEVPLSWRPKLQRLIKEVTSVPGAFLIGFVVSLFLLPCTSGPYIVILGMLAETTTKTYALLLLLIYNFIFVLPMILITLAVYFGFTTTEKAEKWRQKKIKGLHLIAGLIILLLGIGMSISLWLGIL